LAPQEKSAPLARRLPRHSAHSDWPCSHSSTAASRQPPPATIRASSTTLPETQRIPRPYNASIAARHLGPASPAPETVFSTSPGPECPNSPPSVDLPQPLRTSNPPLIQVLTISRPPLTLFPKCFSSFLHSTCSLSVSCPYLALDDVYHPL
jgi:hypothetical protein